jgi:chromosome segregation protein
LVHISKLTVKGFKSFPQRQVTVNLELGLNVITGPNGSGKSNIIDAIRFAMGENSAKSLRQNSMTGLIYDPGTGATDIARVSVTFENGDRSLAVEDDRVTVVRELKPNGDNAYYINGRRIARNSLVELLGAAHITPEGLNVIPQGAIGRLAEFHPNERRQIIESAIGLKHFDEKKFEALDRLRDADNQLAVSFAKLDERRGSIERLEVERNDALRFKQIEFEINRLRKAIGQKRIREADEQLNILARKASELLAQQDQAKSRVAELEVSLKEIEAERDAYYGTNLSVPSQKLIDLGLEIGRLDTQLSGLEEKKREYEHTRTSQRETSNQLDGMLRALDKEAAEVVAEVEGLQEELRRLDEVGHIEAERKKELLRKRERLGGRSQRVEVKDLHLADRKARADLAVSDLHAKVRSLERQLGEATGAHDELVRKYEEVKGMVDTMRRQLSELAADIESSKELLKRSGDNAEACSKQREKLAAEIKIADGILSTATQTILKYESGKEIAEKFLTDELNSQRVEEIAKSGVVEGYRGKLSDVMKYKEQHSSAVRASGQEWLSAMVVDDMDGLLQLAGLSKRLRSARIRILPVSELKNAPMARIPFTEGVLGRLSDFIVCDASVAPAVEFVFGNTVLTSTAKAAYPLSRRGLRCVTAQGDLFEAGGRAMETGRVSELSLKQLGISDPEELKYVEESLKAFRISIDRQRKGLDRLAQSQAGFEKEKFKVALRLENAESRLRTLVPLVRRYEHLEKSSKRRIEEQEEGMVKLKKKLGRGSSLLPKLRTKAAKLAERRAHLGFMSLAALVSGIDGELAEISRSEDASAKSILNVNASLSTLQTRLNSELNPKAGQMRESLTKAKADLSEADENLPKVLEAITALSRQKEELSDEEARIREDSEQALPRLKEIEAKQKGVRDEIGSLQQKGLRLEKEKLRLDSAAQNLRYERENALRAVNELGIEEEVEFRPQTEMFLSMFLEERSSLQGMVNLLADQSYKEAFTSYRDASKRRNELERDRNAIVKFIEEVESEKKNTFMTAYEKLDRELRIIFTKLTDGSAWMELENPADPFSGGVFLMAQFPMKAARESSSTSGGEKAAVAVSFLLAFQSAYPSPFYLLDEIDAPLDAVNSEKLGRLLGEWSSKSQIVVVTLKEAVVSQAANKIGVYGVNGASNAVRYKSKAEVTVNV